MISIKNSSLLEELWNFWMSVIQLSKDGKEKTKLNLLLKTLDINSTMFLQSSEKKKFLMVKKFAIAEFLQINNLKTWIDKLNSVRKNTLITKLLKILEALSTGEGRDLLPFWTEFSRVISKKLWLPTKIDCVDLASNSSNISLKKMESNSWFSIKKYKQNNKNSLMTSSQLLQSFPIDTMEKENMVLRTRKIRLFLNPQQKQTFKKWIGTSRYLYNKSIEIIKNKQYPGKNKLRTKLVTNHDKNWELETPQAIREGGVFDACHAYQSNLEKFKKTKKPFDMKFRRKKSKSQSIVLPVDSLNKDLNLYPKFLSNNSCLLMKGQERKHIKWKDKMVEKGKKKRLEKEKKLKEQGLDILEQNIIKTKVGEVLDKPLRIQYKWTGEWYLCVPIDVKVKTSDSQGGIISLDPGVRTFLTGYSPDGEVIKIGDNDIKKIRNYSLKTDQFISMISKMDKKRKRRCRKAKLKRFEKVRNMIKDCHRKVTKYLIDNYNYIILPPFKTQEMSKKGSRKINDKTVRNMLTWSHYKMRIMLINKSEEYKNKHILCPTEEYTSKTCSNCGNIKQNLGGNKEYKCEKCGCLMDRDINGSRNTLIKMIGSFEDMPNAEAIFS